MIRRVAAALVCAAPLMVSAVLVPQPASAQQQWQPADVPTELREGEARAVEVDADGTVWVGVRGLARWQDGTLTSLDGSHGELPSGVADLGRISGALWAVGRDGASRLGPAGWELLSAFGSLTPTVVFGVSGEPRTSAVWFATNRGAARLADGEWLVMTAEDGLPHAVVHDVLVEPSGVVWLCTRRGLARYADGRIDVHRRDLNFRTALLGPDGRPWFGTSDGFLRWDGASWIHELAGITVYPQLVARDGTVWAGSASSGLLRGAAGQWDRVPLGPGFEDAEVFDVAEAPDASIWVATSAGVARLVRSPGADGG